ncbi:hypothetical protein TDB9533_03808 [Thalassocella blandensis]|nr:hypothetical protein TDB9533_03808 [Thalassocella blandensis]
MIVDRNVIKPGIMLTDPIGRKLQIRDVFVPKNQRVKSASLPSSYRQIGRKVIVFTSGAVMHLDDAARRYSIEAPSM